jgi:hypothetical protein
MPGESGSATAERLKEEHPELAESHRANPMGKLGLTSRVELVDDAEEHDAPVAAPDDPQAP